MAISRKSLQTPHLDLKDQEDSDLLAAVGLGDQRAIATLYGRYSIPVYSVAHRICHDVTSAEEVLQNVFLQLWLAPQQFASGPGSLDGRLALLARNVAIDLTHRRRDTPPGETNLLSTPLDPIGHTEVSLLL